MYRFHLFGTISDVRFKSSLTLLYLAGFVLSMAGNFAAYINSSFIENIVSVNYVGLFFVAANIATFVAMLFFPTFIRSCGNFMSAKWMILINIVSLIFLVINPSALFVFLFFIGMWITSNLLWINMDLFVESFTTNDNTGKTRAIFFTFMNLGWILSPVLATRLVIGESYSLVYLVSAFLLLIFYLIISFNKKKIDKIIKYDTLKIKDIVLDFWRAVSLRGIYISSFFLNLFYSIVVVYMPIYLHDHIGFSWTTLGVMFAFMLIPFVVVEIPAGIIADKYIGEKEMMFLGFGIMTLCLALFFFLDSSSPFVWGSLLFFSRVGAALIEAMRESRFFKIVDAEHVSHINFLRTSYPLGYLIGPGLGALILAFYPIQYIFIFLAIFFIFSFYFVYIIRDSK